MGNFPELVRTGQAERVGRDNAQRRKRINQRKHLQKVRAVNASRKAAREKKWTDTTLQRWELWKERCVK